MAANDTKWIRFFVRLSFLLAGMWAILGGLYWLNPVSVIVGGGCVLYAFYDGFGSQIARTRSRH